MLATESRSSVQMENLQEVLDAEDNTGWTMHGFANQYFTPDSLAAHRAGRS